MFPPLLTALISEALKSVSPTPGEIPGVNSADANGARASRWSQV
jgi:hypothetical protein